MTRIRPRRDGLRHAVTAGARRRRTSAVTWSHSVTATVTVHYRDHLGLDSEDTRPIGRQARVTARVTVPSQAWSRLKVELHCDCQ